MTRYCASPNDSGYDNYKPLALEFHTGEIEVQLDGRRFEPHPDIYAAETDGHLEVLERSKNGDILRSLDGSPKTRRVEGVVRIVCKVMIRA